MAREKAPKPSDLNHALGAALAASKLYAETLDKLITCVDKNDFKEAGALLKTGHEQSLALKDAHNQLYVPVWAAIKAAAPKTEARPPRETKEDRARRKAAIVGDLLPTVDSKDAEPAITEQSADEP